VELIESGIITHHFYRQLTRYIKRLRLMENGFSSGTKYTGILFDFGKACQSVACTNECSVIALKGIRTGYLSSTSSFIEVNQAASVNFFMLIII
jgi:hypothetical protein